MSDKKIEYAEQIAQLVIDKSYWGNDYFILYTLLLVAIVAGITGYFSSYLATKGQLKATSENFEKALDNMEIQVDVLKNIEENISLKFLVKRENFKIKRYKIEKLHRVLSGTHNRLTNCLIQATYNNHEGLVDYSDDKNLLVNLYFKSELLDCLSNYQQFEIKIRNLIGEYADENKSTKGKSVEDRCSDNRLQLEQFNIEQMVFF